MSATYQTRLREKFREALHAVLPIVAIVLVLSLTLAPLSTGIVLAFLLGAAMLVAGMMFFTLGAELSMTTMGERVGTAITGSRRLPVVLLISFALGFVITVSEPDLQVLANQVPAVPNAAILFSVAAGVGLFLAVALYRMLFSVSLRMMLLCSYGLVFLLMLLAPKDFLAVAFDSGGVTTGPMTVPFIMALGIGLSAIRSDRNAAEDSFGLVSLCSVGPILAVLILGIIFRPDNGDYVPAVLPEVQNSVEMGRQFLTGIPTYLKEMALSLLPIAVIFALFQIFSLHLSRRTLLRILLGIGYTYVGLVLFLTGVNVGFMPAGSLLGEKLASGAQPYLLIPIGMLIGYFIVLAEPAVYVLMKQVEEITDGAISGKAMQVSLSVGVSVSVGLAMLRVLTGLSILWLLIPGYLLAIGLSFFVPKIFTAIAFDSGGVASGPMTATFLLPLSIGACSALGGNILADSFGVVSMVAMTPLITIQGLGVLYRIRGRRKTASPVPISKSPYDELDNYAIIEL